ncbi:hypothetical protein SUDANB95_04758 [Actinosynnema sp. ALI-1.44]
MAGKGMQGAHRLPLLLLPLLLLSCADSPP